MKHFFLHLKKKTIIITMMSIIEIMNIYKTS